MFFSYMVLLYLNPDYSLISIFGDKNKSIHQLFILEKTRKETLIYDPD